jgi:acetyl-CoA carboxylase biotin carboxyl carrier protein
MEPKQMEALVRLMRRQGVAEFTYKTDNEEISVRFAGAEGAAVALPVAAPVAIPAAAPVAAPVAAVPAAAPAKDYKVIKAPIVGTFYRSSSPDASPYVKVGDKVRKGQVVCIIEAMKLMNQIESDNEGVVAEICLENGQPVQFGQDLFRLTAG